MPTLAHTSEDATAPRAARRDDPAPALAPEGMPIVAGFVIVGVVLSGAAVWWLGVFGVPVVLIAVVVCVWCVWFFRDPQRAIPEGAELVICPADGVVCQVSSAVPPTELGLGTTPLARVCVFMNIFNVHVNRVPVESVVEKIAYRPGAFFNASFDKASDLNERMSLVLRTPEGTRLVVVQIAGLVARRIVCRVKDGAKLRSGERFGLIRFGSRVDVYLPTSAIVTARVGDRVLAGSSVIATLAPESGGSPAQTAQEQR
jgi:phosphatidylserine decarboxylase